MRGAGLVCRSGTQSWAGTWPRIWPGLILGLGLGCCFLVQSAWAASDIERLSQALRLRDVMAVLHEEGVEQGQALDTEFLGGQGGGHFHAQVADIFDEVWMTQTVQDAMGARMSDADVQASLVFFDTDLGRRLSELELSARRALSDPDIEAAAKERLDSTPEDDPLRRMVVDYVQINDIVGRNVSGIQSSDFSFYRGLVSGGGTQRDDEGYLAALLEESDELRAETEGWALSFHLMAYAPLRPEEVKANVEFSATPAGVALNDALFDGFNSMYDTLYFQLGLAVAQALSATDL